MADARENNGGSRPGAGRKSAQEEQLIADVVNKCWARVNANLDSKKVSNKEKNMIALEVVKRTAPKNIDLTTKGDKLPSPIYGAQSTVQLPGHAGDEEDISTEEAD